MTPEQLAQLAGVNAAVNRIPYDALPAPGEPADWWSDAPVAGRSWVCRDYVLMKADRLKALGWPAAALTVVLCWTETGDYHAVLAVAADGENGDPIILDSRFAAPYPMSAPPALYRWDRRQIAGTTEFAPVG